MLIKTNFRQKKNKIFFKKTILFDYFVKKKYIHHRFNFKINGFKNISKIDNLEILPKIHYFMLNILQNKSLAYF